MLMEDTLGPKACFISYTSLPMSPRPALRDGGGSLPMRAIRYCDALTNACAFGWWLYPPMDIWLMWDGFSVYYSFTGQDFDPLDDSCEFPGMAALLAKHAPAGIQPIASALLTALPEPGLVQISLGVIASTAPGWSLLLRRPANLSLFGGYDMLEGIVETDVWRGPLFINLRLTRTHSPIRLHARAPLVQAQPMPHWVYQPMIMADMKVCNLASMTQADWDLWNKQFVEPSSRPFRRAGEYAVAARQRRKGQSET